MPAEDDNNREVRTRRVIEDPFRRFACDRCRGQKLRCERRTASGVGGGIDNCKRCVKAKVKCVTSPPLRMGRPRQHNASSSSIVPGSHVQDLDTFLSGTGDTHTRSDNGCDGQDADVPAVINPEHNPGGASANGSQPEDDPIDFMFDSHLGLANASLFSEQHFHDDRVGPAPPQPSPYLKEDALQKLSALSGRVFRQLCRRGSGQLDDCLSSSITTLSSDGTDGLRYPIGDLLDSSQQFLEILKHFLHPTSDHVSSHSGPFSLDVPYPDCELDNLGLTPSNRRSTTPLLANRDSLSQLFPTDAYPGDSSLFADLPPLPNPTTGLNSLPYLDFPSILAILTVYVSLVRIYRKVFTHIHSSLLTSSSPSTDLPPFLPGLQLGGFHLDGHRNLQIKILMQVSVEMLDRIEEAVRSLADGKVVGTEGFMDGTVPEKEKCLFGSVLEMVVKHEMEEAGEFDTTGSATLKATAKSINQLLRANW